jgi:hypothetical protein
VAWVVFVLAVAVAGSGLTLALDHPQTDSGRPELTARGDAIVGPRLAAMAPHLADLATATDTLGAQARQTYGDVRTRDTAAARADLPVGDAAAASVTAAGAAIAVSRATLLDGTSLTGISRANRAWVTAIDLALADVALVPTTWTRIADAAVLPIVVVETLAHHDSAVLAAAKQARASDFAGATVTLTEARADLDRAGALAAQAVKRGLDATTLTGLIDRSTTYDAALVSLYAILVQTGGVMTPAAQTALDTVNRAEQALPKDNSFMTIIVSDVGGQAMTLGLIDLEQLRGDISAAANRPGAMHPLRGVAGR